MDNANRRETRLPDKRFFLPQEAAEILRVKLPTLRRYLTNDYIVHIHIPGGQRIPRDELIYLMRYGIKPVRRNKTNGDRS